MCLHCFFVWYALIVCVCVCVCLADTSSISSPQPHTFQINFNSLYTALCEQQRSDQVTLLLYTLLHQNPNMKNYMLSRTDMENLVSMSWRVAFSIPIGQKVLIFIFYNSSEFKSMHSC